LSEASVEDVKKVVAEVLNLKSLAEATKGSALISGTGMQVERISGKRRLEPTSNLLIVVLEGELIIDLPYGDFRILRKNDSLQLSENIEATLNPVDLGDFSSSNTVIQYLNY